MSAAMRGGVGDKNENTDFSYGRLGAGYHESVLLPGETGGLSRGNNP